MNFDIIKEEMKKNINQHKKNNGYMRYVGVNCLL